jgi:hypothetical protein
MKKIHPKTSEVKTDIQISDNEIANKEAIESKGIIRPIERESKLSIFFDDIEEVKENKEITEVEHPQRQEEFHSKETSTNKDFNNLRYKYLIGNIAGEDLFDKNNNLIISRNSVINSEVVAKAENAGKLAELIVNMILPDV